MPAEKSGSTHDLPLLGYVEQWSARPGEQLDFKVSSTSKAAFKAKLFRSISADPNPAGMGIVEEASEYFSERTVTSRQQSFYPGSYGIAQDEISASSSVGLKFTVNMYPTLINAKKQTVFQIGEHELLLDERGVLCWRIADQLLATESPLKIRCWYSVEVSVAAGLCKLIISELSHQAPVVCEFKKSLVENQLKGTPVIAAHHDGESASQFFNGKIEAPSVFADDEMLCGWDFCQAMTSCTVPALSKKSASGLSLSLINFPARAMTGSLWNGVEMNWAHKPEHYAAIHFHEDDIYDFGWETDFSFKVPQNMPSGVYVMRLECEGCEDNIPFFIKPALGQAESELCVLVSTFTYAIYGNHARPDYHPSWQEKNEQWNAYPNNPAVHTRYGLSTYNYHTDGSGICHASHRRPLLNMRSGYLTFGQASCSGLRHFQADSHLISWLHEKKIGYDIVTDQDLHEHGYDAIAPYRVVTTGSHPEYHTEETLNALRDFRDNGGHLMYLGGNGFYWRVAVHNENDSVLEIRRAEDGIRAWAAEPGEYYNAFDGCYGGLWRRNGRAPQALVGVGFAAQGQFVGDPYRRVCYDARYDWVFNGVFDGEADNDDLIGDFGFSGHGAAGFELDHMDHRIGTPMNAVLLARSATTAQDFMLVPEEQLTHLTNLSGGNEADVKHADMIYTEYPGGGSVFATGSITFCGSLPWNNFDNNVSRLLYNVFSSKLGLN